MQRHLSHEEVLLESWGYPRLGEHALEHRNLLVQLDALLSKALNNPKHDLENGELDFIGSWLCSHIENSDKDYARFLLRKAGRPDAGNPSGVMSWRQRITASVTLSRSVLAALILITLAVDIIVVGLMSYGLNATKSVQEREVRAAVESTALLLDHNITESVSKVDLSLREIKDWSSDSSILNFCSFSVFRSSLRSSLSSVIIV